MIKIQSGNLDPRMTPHFLLKPSSITDFEAVIVLNRFDQGSIIYPFKHFQRTGLTMETKKFPGNYQKIS